MKRLFFLIPCVLFAGSVWAADITVSWTAGPNATSHLVMKKVGAASYAQLAEVPMPTLSHQDTAISGGGTYCYKIAAKNSFGTGPDSNECCSALLVPGAASGASCVVTFP